MMFAKGRRRHLHLIVIVALSMFSMLFFQNCGGGINSQSSVLSSDNNNPQSTPGPNPAPAPAPTPAPAPGPVVLPTVPQSARDAYCAQFVDQNAKALLSSPSATSLTMQSANGNGGNASGQDETNNVSMTFNVTRGLRNPNSLPITNIQLTSLPGYGSGYQSGTFNCDFNTAINVSYVNADPSGASPTNFTHGIIMNPNHANYGQNIFSLSPVPRTMLEIAQDATSLPNNMNAIAGYGTSGSLTLSVQLDRTNDNGVQGLRCAQGHFWLRAAARTTVSAGGTATFQTQAVNNFAANEFQYIRVNVNNRCWDETKLNPPNSPVRSSRYGNFVSGSANWIAIASEKDVGDDSGSSVIDSGTVTVFRKNQTTGAWVMCAELTVPGASAYQAITAVSITEDGNQTPRLAIGNANYSSGQGRVTIMSNPTRTCGVANWQFVEHILPPSGSNNADQRFGQALSQTAGRLYVGAPGAYSRQGSVYVYSCDVDSCNGGGGVYRYPIRHGRSSVSGLAPIQPGFGMSLAVSGSNNMLAVGAPQHYGAEEYGDGFVQVVNVASDTGPGTVYTIDAPNRPADGVDIRSGMRFGDSVAIDGNRLAIGAPFRMNGTNSESGSVHYYSNYTASQSATETKLGAAASLFYGRSVGLTTNGYLVGCDGCGTNEGRVFHYTPGNTSTNSNTSNFTLFAQDKELPTSAFGYAMSVINGNQLVVGAPTKPDPNVAGGAAYFYQVRPLLSGTAR